MIPLLLSPVGRILAGCAAVLVLLSGVYLKGHRDGRLGEVARVEAAVNAERARQAAAAASALDAARQREEAREAYMRALQNEVKAYEAELASGPAAAQCIGTEPDAERLRRILRGRAG